MVKENNYFFKSVKHVDKKNFDEYSKTTKQIIDFYYGKHPELDTKYKSKQPLERDVFVNYQHIKVAQLAFPFEVYCVSFLYAMEESYQMAIESFFRCLEMLDDTIESAINGIFMKLQIAQLYERLRRFDKALETLKEVYTAFVSDKDLVRELNSFFASCCVSIGLLYYRYFSNKNIAGGLFCQSIHLRLKYKSNYPPLVCENYLASAYRFKALTYNIKPIDIYIDFKIASNYRYNLVKQTEDLFNRSDFLHLSYDFLYFLITENYPVKFINKIGKSTFNILVNFDDEELLSCAEISVKLSMVLSKYYLTMEDYKNFFKWYSLQMTVIRKTNSEFDSPDENSQYIYAMLKN
ncbi:hypothetical protein [Pedobacter sp. FW305-3-2-15-E-R2A2]|uniref:hypothetical protein n=1 Tax=Pedobacter sp. FW305-3-2-15-E-R2A2 TaxID=3140251 RepID=UPI003140445F